MNSIGPCHLKVSFFVKPFILNDIFDKEKYWEQSIEDYMYAASFQMLPFSFDSLLDLPVFMIDKVYTIQKEITEKRAQQRKIIEEQLHSKRKA